TGEGAERSQRRIGIDLKPADGAITRIDDVKVSGSAVVSDGHVVDQVSSPGFGLHQRERAIRADEIAGDVTGGVVGNVRVAAVQDHPAGGALAVGNTGADLRECVVRVDGERRDSAGRGGRNGGAGPEWFRNDQVAPAIEGEAEVGRLVR